MRSEKDHSFYYVHTSDLDNRLDYHNKGRVRYIKGKRPWKLHYFESFSTKSEAYKREMFFKSIDGYKFLKEINIT